MADAEHENTAQLDASLMIEVAAGNQPSLAALYDRYASLMLALGLRIVGDRGAAEDLLHDVFVEVWQKAGDYDRSRGSVRAWLLLRMRSRALDRVRSAHRRRTEQLEEGAADRIEGKPADPSAAAERSLIRRALADLPDEQREVLELAYYEGLTTTEISEQVSVPVGFTLGAASSQSRPHVRVPSASSLQHAASPTPSRSRSRKP